MTEREKVYNKSGGCCWYCGIDLPKRWHVDHFLPLKRNPDGTFKYPERDIFENKVPACQSCNIMKSDMDIETFRWLIQNFVTRLHRDVSIFRHAEKFGLVEVTRKEVEFWYEKKGRLVES